jgi:hypothetical protein
MVFIGTLLSCFVGSLPSVCLSWQGLTFGLYFVWSKYGCSLYVCSVMLKGLTSFYCYHALWLDKHLFYHALWLDKELVFMRLGLVLSSSNDKEIHVPFSSAARFS